MHSLRKFIRFPGDSVACEAVGVLLSGPAAPASSPDFCLPKYGRLGGVLYQLCLPMFDRILGLMFFPEFQNYCFNFFNLQSVPF